MWTSESENENELLRRIEKLERRNRVFLTGGVAILLVVCLAAAQKREQHRCCT
jgi:hypothetical protein